MSLTNLEIMNIVENYIGVIDGYLGNFTYQSHAEFYPTFCDLQIDPNNWNGTTRQRFIAILQSQSPENQAKILHGVLIKFPLGSTSSRTSVLRDEILGLITRLEWALPISSPSLQNASQTVQLALRDAETSIQAGNPLGAVDRTHTAIHGYLRVVCDNCSINYAQTDSLAKLAKLIFQSHPVFQNLGTHRDKVSRIFYSFGATLDALNMIRNNASLAHANVNLLDIPEARLAINVARSILDYLDTKLT